MINFFIKTIIPSSWLSYIFILLSCYLCQKDPLYITFIIKLRKQILLPTGLILIRFLNFKERQTTYWKTKHTGTHTHTLNHTPFWMRRLFHPDNKRTSVRGNTHNGREAERWRQGELNSWGRHYLHCLQNSHQAKSVYTHTPVRCTHTHTHLWFKADKQTNK